ncbi:EmrB/QacA subfamily drug resistance transporter [Desulfitobacterium sp. LBE]|nr:MULTISPECIES: MDR family MFS transporter [Desulfitobacterium]ACL20849.1 drug resistance transporter, EmrB/QacA subfamily [Desulfitobacterium hafniense DCB-2]EHL07159.1 drug resistance MFS transporter, drug:H+ antiporter-2 family [Desulfitobacterium hafniense DP7]MEA5025771.1 MDR family MFS transporter [Desulfitobacterium hafniense]TWH56327.1 EmrB/QacA subfamily drug resistance transporter [Desulfitobacterium sp. LBE]CDX01734.1 Multidrug resistance protein B homolog [Desulfitobacterium hafni
MMGKSGKAPELEPIPKNIMNIAWILVLGAIMPLLDSTMVNIAINHLSHDFSIGLDLIQWVITGYVLAMAISVPLAGWMVQRFNGKWLMIGANILFLAASIASGFSWSIHSLIIFRVVQGFSAGFIMTLVTTLCVETAGRERMGRLMSTIGIPTVLGPILGPVIGAVIVQFLSWRYIFFVNIPLGILAITLMIWKLPDFTPANIKAKFDFIGIILLGTASAALIYGITKAAKSATFNNSTTIAYGVAGIAILAIYMIYAALKKDQAILPLHLFRLKNFSAVMVGLFLAGIATNGPMLLLPLFFQNIKGFSVLNTGLILIPQGIGMLIARPLIGKLTDKWGARNVVLVSLALTIVGTIPFIFINEASSLFVVSLVLFVRGVGIGGVTIPMMTDAYTGMVKQEIAQASVGTRLMQNIGGAFGSAVMATAVSLSIQGKTPTIPLMTTAYHDGFMLALVLSLVLVIPSLFLTNKTAKQ